MITPRFDDHFRQRISELVAWRRDVRRFRPEPLARSLRGPRRPARRGRERGGARRVVAHGAAQRADEEIGRAAAEVEQQVAGAEGRLAQAESRHAELLTRRERRRTDLERQRSSWRWVLW